MNITDTNTLAGHLFGNWRFNANTGDLSDGETTTRLEPQVAKLLEYFLDHQNTLTSRDELIAAVWDNRIVSDDAINRCVSILRQVLTPDDKNAYIETVVRRGFISHFPAPPTGKPLLPLQAKRKNRLILLALVGLSAILFYSAFERFNDSPAEVQSPRRTGTPMVAVLPFTSSGFASDSEIFANGMHDDLLTQLAQLQSIRVISRTSVLEFKDTKLNVREIGKALGADAVLEGGIQHVGNKIRINAQLIDAKSDEHLWAGQYDRELLPANIFAIQTEITQAIASALHTTLTEQDTAQLGLLPTENMAAYRAYHRAMKLRDTYQLGDATYNRALEEAVALDPGFVRAWAELAGSLSFENFSENGGHESIERIEKILKKIHSLAPESADYMIAQAYYTYYILKNYERSHQLIQQAHILRPSDERVLELKSWIERRLGDFDARIASLRLAQSLDPRNPIWTRTLTRNLIINHQYDEANQEIEKAKIDNSSLAALHSMLQLRDYQRPVRWIESLTAIEKEYGVAANPHDLWSAHVANRAYVAAAELLKTTHAISQFRNEWVLDARANTNITQLITYWLQGAQDQLDELVIEGQKEFAVQQDADGKFSRSDQYLVMAFLSAAEGNTEETGRLTRVWQRETSGDLAALSVLRHYPCQALGMAAATTAAVECIRSGLVEPSLVMPFIEPFLPYYDLIREEPEFVSLLAEVQEKRAGTELTDP